MKQKLIIREAAKLLIPFILLFGFYVITHGETGPGGGFQGGVILASAFILYTLAYGPERAQRVLSTRQSDPLISVGVWLFAGVGVASMLLGGLYLDYNVFNPAHPPAGQTLGIFLVEIGVGITVAAVMITLFNEMSRTRRH